MPNMHIDAHRQIIYIFIRAMLAFSLLVGLAACSRLPVGRSSQADMLPDWGYTDLRGIDSPDTPQPEQDLLAVYLRRSSSIQGGLEIRLDFLDLPLTPGEDILLAFDFLPGGVAALPSGDSTDILWDALLVLPAEGSIQAFNTDMQPINNMAVRLLHDPVQDSLQISLDGASLYGSTGMGLPPNLKIQAFTASTITGEIADRSPIAALSALPPPPVPLLLAFWNTFPAYTPAQALRRWDGAHTGLFGGRDGLYNMLRAARNHATPLVLLDLKIPAWLSALDYAGDLDLVKSLVSSGLVLAPDVWINAQSESLPDYSVKLAESYGFPMGDIAYAQDISSLPPRYRLVFVPSMGDQPLITVARSSSLRVIPVPIDALQNDPAWRLNPTGLSLDARRLLAMTAFEASENPPIVILGGDLSQSGWGSPEAARLAFGYLRNHPWIHVIDPDELRAAPLQAPFSGSDVFLPSVSDLPSTSSPTLNSDPLTQAAAQAALTSLPVFTGGSSELSELRRIYGAQGKVLLSAARWAQNPAPIAGCDEDLDGDGLPECILASEKIYTVYNLELGTLTHAFALGRDGPHQWIAPSSQLSFGTGDPSTWNLSAGLAADPTVIPGAFGDQVGDKGGPYHPQIEPGKLILTNTDGRTVKTFTLLDDSLQVELDGLSGSSARLPLAIDPWLRFQPDWWQHYKAQRGEGSIDWGTEDFRVRVTSPGTLTLSAYNDTRQLMSQVENPNTEYPPGHYLPFPVALVEAEGEPGMQLQITFQTK